MFKDEDGFDLNLLGIGVVGEVMLILFVSVVITASVKTQLLHNQAFGNSRGERAPGIGLKIEVGPGTSILVDRKVTPLEKAIARAEKVPESEKVQVRMHINGDPEVFWKLRIALKKLGCGYVEAPPVGVDRNRKEKN